MPALAYPSVTTEERDATLEVISRHFTEVIADAESTSNWETASLLLAEAADWAGDHELTAERIGQIHQWATPPDWALVSRYLDGGQR